MRGVKQAPALTAALIAALILVTVASTARAREDVSAQALDEDRPPAPSGFADLSANRWLVGVAGDYNFDTDDLGDVHHHFILGISAAHRWDWFSLGGKLLMSPDGIAMALLERGGVENIRSLLGSFARAAFEIGSVEMLYGVGFHAELRLRRHFWMMCLTPLEIGTVLWRQGSWNIQLLTGLRIMVAGELLNVFVLDPNGFDDSRVCDPVADSPQCELDRVKQDPWYGFVGLVFARRID